MKKLRKQTGELLLSWNHINQEQLDHALFQQKTTGKRVGQLLLEQGAISQEKLADVIAEQAGLPRIALEPEAVKNCFGRLPAFLVLRHRVIPFADVADGALRLAVFDVPSDEVMAEIEQTVDRPVELFIATDQEISASLNWYSMGDETIKIKAMTTPRKPLGDFLVEMGVLTAETLGHNLADYDRKVDGRIGAYLLLRGVISQEQLNQALNRQREAMGEMTNSNLRPWSAA